MARSSAMAAGSNDSGAKARLARSSDCQVVGVGPPKHRLPGTRIGILGMASLFVLVSHAQEEVPHTPLTEVVDRLPNIVEFLILDDSRVYLRTGPNRVLDRITPEGGFHHDRHFIDAETGEMELVEGSLAQNEIVLNVGEGSADGHENVFNVLRLKDIREGTAEFHHTGWRRGRTEINRVISARPYREVGGQTEGESAGRKSVFFRSDWKWGLRAEVTEDLVAMLKVGMTEEEVASILERPSRWGDVVAEVGDSDRWTFTVSLARILILTFEDGKLVDIGGG